MTTKKPIIGRILLLEYLIHIEYVLCIKLHYPLHCILEKQILMFLLPCFVEYMIHKEDGGSNDPPIPGLWWDDYETRMSDTYHVLDELIDEFS
jgi:hypothetical protein